MTTVPTESTSDDAALRGAVGKFFRRMVPLLVVMLIVNQMDRTNIGFVRHDLEADLGIGAAAYGLGAGLFFVAYALFEVPSNVLMERFGARVWLTRIMISWGVVVFAMAFITDTTTFYAMRFLLGVAEAGFFPGVMYYFTRWLPDRYRGRAVAIFLGGSAGAYVVTGPVTGALLELDGVAGLAGWKWMFLAQGVISVLIGVVAAFLLVSRIGDAKWLTAEEGAALAAAVAADDAHRADAGERVSKTRLLLHPQVLLLCFIFFAISLTGYAITFWLPSLVSGIAGLPDFGVGLVSAVPWACAIAAMYLMGRFTDRTGVRRPYVTVALVVAAVGTFLATLGSPWFGVGAMCVAAVGFKCSASIFWPIAQQGLDGKIVAPGIALVNSLGNLGGFVAPTAIGLLEETTGSTTYGLYGLSAASLLAAGLATLIGRRRSAAAR
ncbi:MULTISPECIES: MFS transporter [unclassified Saccharopolyspora]|uniref:MFS transporter n=1 Tax=unclassified Saccharopolyspora TaxID=2646250 RepID=UPI001CD8127B|nr:MULTISPECIES: MFS transporter [unclassified Saccharopolyspora]MCA1187029.1 MFS transporter [Saccharopolyspora sp. 6T]MCA1280166.1 MFS transporter [Saccharopolyspora sp. 7B]